MSALAGLLRKEVYHILRDRRTLVVIVAMPIVQVIIFGYAIRTDVDHVRLAIVDPAPDPVTLAIRSAVRGRRRVRARRHLADGRRAGAAVPPRRRTGRGGVRSGFAERLARGLPAGLLIVADATEPNTGSIVAAYASAVVQGYEQRARCRAAAPFASCRACGCGSTRRARARTCSCLA